MGNRSAKGRFGPGNNANPRGRPPVGESIAEYIRHLSGANGKVYVDKLHAIATEEHKNVMARMQAIGVLLERGFGKPPQDVNLKGQLDTRTTVNHHYDMPKPGA